jgi:hypothetical protein
MMPFFSEIEKMFHDEVRDKKRTASGVHHKTGKNGYVGTMRFPSDIMNRSEKMKHRKAGKIVTTNIFDNILPIDEFNKLEDYEKKNRLQYWRNIYSNKEIQEKMGVANSPFYKIVKELDLPKTNRFKSNEPTKRKGKVKEQVAIQSNLQFEEEKVPEVPEAPKPATIVQEVVFEGLNVMFRGTYTADKIEKQLTKFMLLLDGEDDEEFYVELKLMQKQPN